MKRWRGRRKRWLDQREADGRTRPRPLVVRVANAMSVSAPPKRARRIWRKALRKRGRYGRPDLVLACEMADVNARQVAQQMAPGVWQVVQRGQVGSPESALAIAVRRKRGRLDNVRLLDGSPATSEGGGIRRRPILTAHVIADPDTPAVWSFPAAVGHAPPPRAPRARARFLAALAKVRAAVVGGDLNLIARLAARALGRRVAGVGVLNLSVRRRIPTSKPARVDIGGDHRAVDYILWP